MPYVERDTGGKIVGLYAQFQAGIAEEFVDNAVITPPPPRVSLDTLNQTLTLKGSVVRALAMVMFAEINKLRVKNGDPPYTLTQFKNALTNEMDQP